jgi:hypothetical protein
MPRRRWMFALLAALGCGEEVVPLEPVPLDKLPAGAIETATKALPGITIERARKSKFNGQDAYELIGKDKRGKIREVELSTDGKVLEIE